MTIAQSTHTYAARNMNAPQSTSMMLRGPTIPHDAETDAGADAAAAAAAAAEAAAATEAAAAAAQAALDAAKDDKTKPTDAEAALLKDVMKQKKAAQEAKDALAAANLALKAFEGIDPVKVRELIAAQTKAELTEAEKRGEYDRIVAQMREQGEAALTAANAATQTIAEQLAASRKQIDELTVGASFANSKFIADETVLTPVKARKLYDDHFETVDGALVAYDKPRGSKERTPLVDASGDHLSFEVAIEKIIRTDPDFDRIGRSKIKPGAGSGASDLKGGAAGENEDGAAKGVNRISAGLKASGLKK